MMSSAEWLDAVRALPSTVAEHLPAIVGALLLLAVGWLTAKLLALLGRALTERLFDRLARKRSLANALDVSGARAITPSLIGASIFWIVLIVFVVATVETVGLPILSDLFGRFAAYVPNIIAAAALIVGGLLAARLTRGSVFRAATLMRLEHQAESLAGLSQGIILAIAAVMALEQLGLQGRVLELILAITVGSVLAAVGLAFALGARTAVANIVAARYVTQLLRVGQEIRVDGVEGTVAQITSTAVVIASSEGRVIVPAARFHESCPVLIEGS